MILRGIDFGDVWGASGVQGFFGEGYWFHKLPFLWPDFTGMTFVSKTATLFPRKGNMSLNKYYRPKKFFPSCVKVKFFKGLMLNSVGLSNPGIDALLEEGIWQKRKEPFIISVASVEDSQEKRLEELRAIVRAIKIYKKQFLAPFGLQINLSCPNTGHAPQELIGESEKVLDIAKALDVPLIPKYSIASAPIRAIMELNDNVFCDAICVSNTLPFGWRGLDWKKMWGSNISSLADLGGGGLSGKELCPLVCQWIRDLKRIGFRKPINGGGGIFSSDDVVRYLDAGAASIFLGSVATLRPWKVKGIIKYANNLQWN